MTRALLGALLIALISGQASGAPGDARLPGERMLVDEISKMDQHVLEMDKREAELQLQTDTLTGKKLQHEAELRSRSRSGGPTPFSASTPSTGCGDAGWQRCCWRRVLRKISGGASST